MAHWLIKSEPFKWSWEMQVAAGAKGTHWDGVRNHLAKLHLMAMKKGDTAFFYHSNVGKEIVGIVEVIRQAYPDPTADPGTPWVVCDFKAVRPLKRAITLAEVKATPALAGMQLLTSARLSVQKVTEADWKLICKMGGL